MRDFPITHRDFQLGELVEFTLDDGEPISSGIIRGVIAVHVVEVYIYEVEVEGQERINVSGQELTLAA
jgi:hypothetical protein